MAQGHRSGSSVTNTAVPEAVWTCERLLRHPTAFFRAFTAGVGTPLAMIHLMLRAF